MASSNQRPQKGTVAVLNQKGLLRLWWRIEGSAKRTLLYLRLPDTRSNRKKVELLAKQSAFAIAAMGVLALLRTPVSLVAVLPIGTP